MIIFRRISVWISLIGFTAVVVLVLRMRAQMFETPPPPPIAPAVKPYTSAIAASGLVESRNENTRVATPVAGLVTRTHVKVWDRVKAGDALFELDDRDLQAQWRVLKSQLQVSEATLSRVRDQYARLSGVDDPRVVSKDDLTTRRNDVAVAEAQVEAARAAVDQARTLLDRLVVRAPIDGTILQLNTRAGEYLTPGAATPPLVLGDVDEVQVRADVDEQIAALVRAGRDAVGFMKGDTKRAIPLRFVRIEPLVVPKTSLTGASTERVDTRVLQVIFAFASRQEVPIYVGQQMDVYIQN